MRRLSYGKMWRRPADRPVAPEGFNIEKYRKHIHLLAERHALVLMDDAAKEHKLLSDDERAKMLVEVEEHLTSIVVREENWEQARRLYLAHWSLTQDDLDRGSRAL